MVLSERAQHEVRSIFEREGMGEEKGLRLSVVGGGCSGLSYEMDFSEQRPNDTPIVLRRIYGACSIPNRQFTSRALPLIFRMGFREKALSSQTPTPPTPAAAVSPSASESLLFDGGETRLDDCVVVAVEGGDRERFLHSQLTSDVGGLTSGRSQITALLDRAGRLQVFGFLHKRPERLDLLLPSAAAGNAIAFLEGHIIADDVSLRRIETGKLRLLLGAEGDAAAAGAGDRDDLSDRGVGEPGLRLLG